MQSPFGALIITETQKDISSRPAVIFKDEAKLAADMALIIHWIQVADTIGAVHIGTLAAKKIFREICGEALDKRQIEANGMQMERNRQIVSYKDEIDNLKNQIHTLEQRLKRKDERRNTGKTDAVEGNVERHTPIPDHARGSNE